MQTHSYKSIMDCVRKTYAEERLGGFFRGKIFSLAALLDEDPTILDGCLSWKLDPRAQQIASVRHAGRHGTKQHLQKEARTDLEDTHTSKKKHAQPPL